MPYPRSWDVGPSEKIEDVDVDAALIRVSDAVVSELEWDEIEPIVNPVLDALARAGYVAQWGGSPTGCFWEISDEGHERLRSLGHDD